MKNKVNNAIDHFIHLQWDWLKYIYKLKWKYVLIFLFTVFCFGRIILFKNPFPHSLFHQITLTLIIVMTVYSLKYAYKKTEDLLKISSGIHQSGIQLGSYTLTDYIMQMKSLQKSFWWPVIALLCGIAFVEKNMHIEFVPRNGAGYFAGIFGGFTFALALLGYSQIVISLFIFSKIAKNTGNCIPVLIPSDLLFPPKWLVSWVELFQKIEKIFFIVGMMFTLEYVLLMPSDLIRITNGTIQLHTKYKKQVVSGWCIIIFFIIIALPYISFFIRYLMKQLLKNMNHKILQEHYIFVQSERTVDLLQFKESISQAVQFGKYIYDSKSSIPAITTAISILLNCLKIYEIFRNIPLP